jgi:hypothetical protein
MEACKDSFSNLRRNAFEMSLDLTLAGVLASSR